MLSCTTLVISCGGSTQPGADLGAPAGTSGVGDFAGSSGSSAGGAISAGGTSAGGMSNSGSGGLGAGGIGAGGIG
ncbi:MAG TPA: hypothetical protein VGI10_26575, partial [Polyangiaceae bacterium]